MAYVKLIIVKIELLYYVKLVILTHLRSNYHLTLNYFHKIYITLDFEFLQNILHLITRHRPIVYVQGTIFRRI